MRSLFGLLLALTLCVATMPATACDLDTGPPGVEQAHDLGYSTADLPTSDALLTAETVAPIAWVEDGGGEVAAPRALYVNDYAFNPSENVSNRARGLPCIRGGPLPT
jgi:hypothetical protein